MNTLRKTSILALGLLAASIPGMAHIETTGTVLGAVTTLPRLLPSVTIELRDATTSTVRRTKTNENGGSGNSSRYA
jgi:hypothetical protein